MTLNRIILHDGKPEAEADEKRLLERRSNIVQGLESARLAMESFLGRKIEYADLEPFIQQPSASERKEMALKLWIKVTNQTLPNMFVKLSSAIVTPNEVIQLLEGIAQMDGWKSDDPKRYWDDRAKAFVVLTASKEEKDVLIERNRVYCANNVDPEFAKFALQYVRLINMGNSFFTRRAGGTFPDSPDFPQFLAPLVEARKRRAPDTSINSYEYRLKDGMITAKGKHEWVFDESQYTKTDDRRDFFTSVTDLSKINSFA